MTASANQNVAGSDQFDRYPVGMCRQSLDVSTITGEDGSARFCYRSYESVNSRSGSGASAQPGCSSCNRLADRWVDDAHLQETVRISVVAGTAVQRFNENHCRYDGKPQFFCPEGSNKRGGGLGTRRKARQSTAVEHKHAQPTRPSERSRTRRAIASALACCR